MSCRRDGTGQRLRWLSILLFIVGCSHAPPSSEISSPVSVSDDGHLRYQVPDGWFDGTGNPGSLRAMVWLVRRDYAASISVNRIELNREARQEFGGGRLLRLGQLTMQLLLSSRSAVVIRAPVLVRMDGKEYCLYEVEEPSTHDLLCSVVFDTGETSYEVTALVAGGEAAAARDEVLAAHRSFVRRLQW